MQYIGELDITHKCKWTGCNDLECDLCRQCSDRCFHDLCRSQILRSTGKNDRNGILSAQLKADCEEPFSVAIATNLPLTTPETDHVATEAMNNIMPTHLQLSLLDSSDSQCIRNLVGDSTPEEMEEIFLARQLIVPRLLRAGDVKGSGNVTYNKSQLVIPFVENDSPQSQGRYWAVSHPLCVYSEHQLRSIKNKAGSLTKTLTLLIQGVVKDPVGDWQTVKGLKPYISQPFTFFTRRREDKGGIPRRSTKLEKLEDMAGATASKFQNLASHVPANLDIDTRMLPQEPITTAGALYDYISALPDRVLEQISNKVLGRAKSLLQNVRNSLAERMITVDDDNRPRIWCHSSANLGMVFSARMGTLVSPDEQPPIVFERSSGAAKEVSEAELEILIQRALQDWFAPYHAHAWHVQRNHLSQLETQPSMGDLTGFSQTSAQDTPPNMGNSHSSAIDELCKGEYEALVQNFQAQAQAIHCSMPFLSQPMRSFPAGTSAPQFLERNSQGSRTYSQFSGNENSPTISVSGQSPQWNLDLHGGNLQSESSQMPLRFSAPPLQKYTLESQIPISAHSLPNSQNSHQMRKTLNNFIAQNPQDSSSPSMMRFRAGSNLSNMSQTPSQSRYSPRSRNSPKARQSPRARSRSRGKGEKSPQSSQSTPKKRERPDSEYNSQLDSMPNLLPGTPYSGLSQKPIRTSKVIQPPKQSPFSDERQKTDFNPFARTESPVYTTLSGPNKSGVNGFPQSSMTLIPETTSVKMAEAYPEEPAVSGSSYTATMSDSPSIEIANRYNSTEQLPPLPSLKTVIFPSGDQISDKLFGPNLSPVPTLLHHDISSNQPQISHLPQIHSVEMLPVEFDSDKIPDLPSAIARPSTDLPGLNSFRMLDVEGLDNNLHPKLGMKLSEKFLAAHDSALLNSLTSESFFKAIAEMRASQSPDQSNNFPHTAVAILQTMQAQRRDIEDNSQNQGAGQASQNNDFEDGLAGPPPESSDNEGTIKEEYLEESGEKDSFKISGMSSGLNGSLCNPDHMDAALRMLGSFPGLSSLLSLPKEAPTSVQGLHEFPNLSSRSIDNLRIDEFVHHTPTSPWDIDQPAQTTSPYEAMANLSPGTVALQTALGDSPNNPQLPKLFKGLSITEEDRAALQTVS